MARQNTLSYDEKAYRGPIAGFCLRAPQTMNQAVPKPLCSWVVQRYIIIIKIIINFIYPALFKTGLQSALHDGTRIENLRTAIRQKHLTFKMNQKNDILKQ